MAKLPGRVVGGYWTYWGNPIRLKDIPAGYNTVFLFHATPVGGAPGSTGAVQWNTPGNGRGAATNFKADLAEFRKTRTAILTVGGANANVDLSTRTRSQAFLDSIKRIYSDLGGFDGLDWNNYEGSQTPNTTEMIWISKELKKLYGESFAITSPPAPWRAADLTHCKAMLDAGVMDMASPQYYDGPGLNDADFIIRSVSEWVTRMGDQARVGVGFGLANAANYSSLAQVTTAWKALVAKYPNLRGAFNWDMPTDENQGWLFANQVAPLVMQGAPKPPDPVDPTDPVDPPIVPPIIPPGGGLVKIGSTSYKLTGTDVPRGADELVAYTDKQASSPANQYGCEVIVQNSKVTTVNDRQASGSTTGTPIPKGTVLLSGHGAARTWLLANAKVGVTVEGLVKPTDPVTPPSLGLPVLEKGSTNKEANKTLRGLLSARRADGSFDGVFGDDTDVAVKAFQTRAGLTANGKVDEATWKKLLGL